MLIFSVVNARVFFFLIAFISKHIHCYLNLEKSCFTMLCWVLPYNNVDQP